MSLRLESRRLSRHRLMTPTPFKRVKVSEGKVVSQIIDGEAIIINMETGCYYSLDKVGAEIWRCIEEALTVPEIAKAVEMRYDCRGANLAEEVGRLLGELRNEELVETFVDNGEIETAQSPDRHGQRKDGELPVFESPRLGKHTDMREFLLVDPIHHVDDRGWPSKRKS